MSARKTIASLSSATACLRSRPLSTSRSYLPPARSYATQTKIKSSGSAPPPYRNAVSVTATVAAAAFAIAGIYFVNPFDGIATRVESEASKSTNAETSKQTSNAVQGKKRSERDSETAVSDTAPMRVRMAALVKEVQQEIVAGLEEIEGKKFYQDHWQRPEGGEGISCVLQDGDVFEKAGIMVSVIYGTLPEAAVAQMRNERHKDLTGTGPFPFFAAGISLVVHPKNPHAPTVHLNYRYFEIEDEDGSPKAWWFGGGTDLTPAYLFPEDVTHFHDTLRDVCDRYDPRYYPDFKAWCDKYFYIPHRKETRGVGGIFYDDLADKDPDTLFRFARDNAKNFLPSYLPIVERRKDMKFTEEEKRWQQLRRGRYAEFNLVYDRGTKFGLMTPGARIESILVSLPLTARWEYCHAPDPGSPEADLVEVLQAPRAWASS